MRRYLPLTLIALFTLAFVGCAGMDEVRDDDADPTMMSVAEVAGNAAEFSTLAQAIEMAGLTEALDDGENLTVFAPTNRAFEKLPAEIRTELMKPENRSELAEVLRYHVAASRFMSDDLVARGETMNVGSVETLQGDRLSINAGQSALLVNEAAIVQADIVASNGVIHAVDEVLLPPTYDDAVR